MPEETEIEMEKVHEAVKEEMEREGGAFLRRISLTTAILAVFAAIASLRAGATVNEALALKTEATRLQAEASDMWAYYQAKGIKGSLQEASRATWLALGKTPPPQYEEKMKRYGTEQVAIQEKARDKERQRDEKLKESESLLHEHHSYADAVALFQVSIALGAVAALARARMIWYCSLFTGLVGIIFFTLPFFR